MSLLGLIGKESRAWRLRLLEICISRMVLCWEAVLELLTQRVYTQSVHCWRLTINLLNRLSLRLVGSWGLMRVGVSLDKRLQDVVKCMYIRLGASLIIEDHV